MHRAWIKANGGAHDCLGRGRAKEPPVAPKSHEHKETKTMATIQTSFYQLNFSRGGEHNQWVPKLRIMLRTDQTASNKLLIVSTVISRDR